MDFNKKVEIHVHETNLPSDKDNDTYYISPQVLSRFKDEMKIKKNSTNKTIVDLKDLLVSMVGVLVKVQIVQKIDENATLSYSLFVE